jgi:hypothetical protein
MSAGGRFVLAFTPKEDAHAVASFPKTVYRFYAIEETERFLSEAGFRNVAMVREPVAVERYRLRRLRLLTATDLASISNSMEMARKDLRRTSGSSTTPAREAIDSFREAGNRMRVFLGRKGEDESAARTHVRIDFYCC